MRILLDTCTFLWILSDDRQLSDHARGLFSDPDNEVFLSSVSAWEITVKCDLGKLSLPAFPGKYIPEQREKHEILSLPLEEEATFYLAKLPKLHKDPFDRILICQAITSELLILTPDDMITQYPLRTEW